MRIKTDRRYQDEIELRRWLHRRNRTWQHWAVWRVLFWAILVGVAVATGAKWYVYR